MAHGEQKGQIIETPYLKVEKNCLEIENTCIQLSNISLFSTANLPIPDVKRLIFAFVLGLFGIGISERSVPLGLALIVAGIFLACLWCRDYEKAKTTKCLTIVTNSGRSYPILFKEKEFMEEVMRVMTQIMRNNSRDESITIDIENCTFNNSPVTGEVRNILEVNET